MSVALTAAVSTTTPGSALPLQPTDVDGFMVRLMLELQSTLGFSLNFTLVTLPSSLLPVTPEQADFDRCGRLHASSRTQTPRAELRRRPSRVVRSWVQYAFTAMNQTCVMTPLPANAFRRLYARQTVRIFSYGFQARSQRAGGQPAL